jgi:hypothetical protein
VEKGSFITEPLVLPLGKRFSRIRYVAQKPGGTILEVNILDTDGNRIVRAVRSGDTLNLRQSVRLEFLFATTDPTRSPALDEYSLEFE